MNFMVSSGLRYRLYLGLWLIEYVFAGLDSPLGRGDRVWGLG